MKKWNPPFDVQKMIRSSGNTIRSYSPSELLDDATFKIAGPIMTKFGMGGITFHKNHIILSKDICESNFTPLQAKIVYHELVHVAQQKDMGWIKFMSCYIWEWTKCGFSYKKMKNIGLEYEAYTLADRFIFGGHYA